MTDDSARIDELRRRVQQDPASIAFAHLADEHRRAGDLQEAVRVCRAGLEHHPSYLLAHVTLGRALMELAEYPEARTEFEYVLRVAPDNLIALKGMEELHQREDPAPVPAPQGAGVARAPLKLRPDTDGASPRVGAPLVVVTSSSQAPATAAPQAQVAAPPQTPVATPPEAPVASAPEPQVASPPEAQVASPPPEAVNPALDELEGWLAELNADREDSRPGGSASASAKRNPP